MAKSGLSDVEKALKKGFASKGASVTVSTEKSGFKDFIRIFVVSDFFRYKNKKERLGEIFSMLEENGAKDALGRISLCVTMTKREHDREFGKHSWVGRLGPISNGLKPKPRVGRRSAVRSRG